MHGFQLLMSDDMGSFLSPLLPSHQIRSRVTESFLSSPMPKNCVRERQQAALNAGPVRTSVPLDRHHALAPFGSRPSRIIMSSQFRRNEREVAYKGECPVATRL